MAETIKCKCCEKEIPNDSVFCPFCGVKQKTNKFKFWESIKNFHLSLKTILIAIAVGVWVIVFQNIGMRNTIDSDVVNYLWEILHKLQ